jgi:hypothetical protein
MPAHVRPVSSEIDGLLAYLEQQLDAFRQVAYGLTDEQARATPTASALSVGSLVKHAAGVTAGWTARLVAAPGLPVDDRSFEEQLAAHADEHLMREDETLAGVLARLDEQQAASLAALATLDPDTPVPVPQDAPWWPRDVDHWSVRWGLLHLVEELARHAGHADIIRETLDGATMYELLAAREGWPETDWLKPWRPAACPASTGD